MNWIETLEAYHSWQRYTVIVVLIGMICLGFYYFKWVPAQQEIAMHDKKIQQLDAKINKGLAMKDKLEEFRKEVFQLKEKMRLAKEVLGDRPNVDLLVKSMENIASQCGLTVEKFQPIPERQKGFYGEIPVAISLFGQYHQLGFFFDKIANEARIMNITDLQISSYSQPGATISAQCMLTAFWYIQR